MKPRSFYGTTTIADAPTPGRTRPSTQAIEVKLDRAAFLFDPLDPFPPASRGVAKPVEAFILERAHDLGDGPVRIIVRFPVAEVQSAEARQAGAAISAHFAKNGAELTRDLQSLFRTGRLSLLIGLAVLALSTIGAGAIREVFASPIAYFASEGLIILGWVANWRPIEIFLYEWWPISRARRLNRRIANAVVHIQPNL